jgi:uncharacterized membrane protein
LITLNAVLVSIMAFSIGAWPVVPFAGLEVLLLAVAFAVVGHHDNDFELLEVSEREFRWEARSGRMVSSLRGNLAWLQVERCRVGSQRQQCLRLRYAGREVLLGRGLDGASIDRFAARLAASPMVG